MPDEKYRIIYEGVPDKATRGIDSLIAKLKALDVQVEKTNAKIRTVGVDRAGVTKLIGALVKLDEELKSKVKDAGAAEKALTEVGKGNRSVAALTKRLAELEAQLKGVTAAGTAAGAATAGVGKGAGGGGGGGGRAASTLGVARAVAGHAALLGARKTYGLLGESMGNRREFLSGAADTAGQYRAGLQELAVLQGKSSADDALVKEQLAFNAASNQAPEPAMTHRLEYGGAIGTVPPQNLGAGVKEGLELESARFGARYSLDPETSGRLAGLIGNFQKIPTVAEGVGTMAEGAEVANVYGVGQVKGIMRAGLQLTGEMMNEEGGRFGSFKGLMARLSATTKDEGGSAPRAATRVRQSNRLLRKLAQDHESALGLKAGIKPEDDYETALAKLAPHITGANGDTALRESGYKNDTEIKATINEAKTIDLVKRIMADPKMSAARTNAAAANAAFGESPTGMQRAAENAEFAATVNVGLEGERLRTMKTAARARMASEGTLKAGLFGSMKDAANSAFTTAGGISGEDLRIDREAMAGLIQGGQKVNVDVRKLAPTAAHRMDAGMALDEDAVRKEINRAYQAVEAAGGDPMGGAPKEAARKLRAAADALDKVGQNDRPQGPPPPGNGGAGVNPGRR